MVLALVTGQLRATPRKNPPADLGPGRIAWFDITTTNLPQSKEFYGKLFDWQFTPVQGTDQAAEIVAGGTQEGETAGRHPRGRFSLQSTRRGRAVAVFVDPAGHPVGLYSRIPPAPSPTR